MNNRPSLRGLTAAALFLVCAALARAGELPDPTRPPVALRPQAVSAIGPSVPAAPALVLQSVLVGEGRTPTAIINGRVVELGGTFEGRKLVKVFDQGAQLAGPQGAMTLALTPESAKVAVAAPAAPVVALHQAATRRSDGAAILVRAGAQK